MTTQSESTQFEPNKIGEMCEGEIIPGGLNPGSTVRGEFRGFQEFANESAAYIHVGHQLRLVTRASLRPAPSASEAASDVIDVLRQTVKCDDCGTELNATKAYKRTRVVNGSKEYVPGKFCASCPIKPSVPERPSPKRDPYVCHRETMASILSGSAYEQGGVLEQSIAFQTANKSERATARIAKRDQDLAALSRPLLTGPLKNCDKYGQKLSLRGWDTDDAD